MRKQSGASRFVVTVVPPAWMRAVSTRFLLEIRTASAASGSVDFLATTVSATSSAKRCWCFLGNQALKHHLEQRSQDRALWDSVHILELSEVASYVLQQVAWDLKGPE